jgi:two-component system OmpR family sensor kinase
MSIRVRLALWFTLILGVVLAALSLAASQLTSDSLLSELHRDVRQRASELVATVGPSVLAGNAVEASVGTRTIDVFSQLDVYCQVVDAQGDLVARSSNLGSWRLPFMSSPSGELQHELPVGRIPLILDQQPVFLDGRLAGYVIVGRSPSVIYQALGRLRGVLYPAAGIAVLLAGLAGWLLVRRAIRPLDRMGATAAAIAASQDHSQRLAYAGPNDEIGKVARTIDDMLAALEQAHSQVEAANASQRQFLLDVSHELRTPLTIMLSSLDVLARTGEDDPAFLAKTLRDIRAEADRMRRMVHQLLIMARSDTDLPMGRGPVLLAETLADACRQTWTNGTTLNLDKAALRELEDTVVEGDGDYLKQLFLILLDNAVKYTPSGGAVSVTGQVNGGTVAVEVADTGIGIPDHDLPRIFERFYRADNARITEGSGLGLAIAQRIASLHGGRIAVTSRAGVGSAFTVTLPVLATQRETD